VQALGDWLVVHQSREIHEEIQRLLRLRGTANLPDAAIRRSTPAGDHRPGEQRLRTALERDIALNFVETPLSDALEYIASEAGIQVVLSAKRLEEAGVNPDTPVTLDTPPAPLANQLRLMLVPLELSFVTRHEVLLVTTESEASSQARMPVRVYDIRQLASPRHGVGTPGQFIDFVTSLIEPDSWDEVGGPAGAAEFRGQLIVRQSDEAHERIDQLLSALATHCRRQADSPAKGPGVIDLDASAVEQQIERTLERQVDVSITAEPVEQALGRLAKPHGLPLVFGGPAAEDARGNRVTFAAPGVTLGTAMDQLLEPWNLTWTIQYRALLVIEKQKAQRMLDVRLYRVDDLLAARAVDSDEFAQDVVRAVSDTKDEHARTAWMACGLDTGWLVISADLHLHHRVADLLHQWRTGTTPQRERERGDFASGRARGSQPAPQSPYDDDRPTFRNTFEPSD
jgi:hypothetical protein